MDYFRRVAVAATRDSGRAVPEFVVAGDIFHTPCVSPELVNLALDWFPHNTIAVAGNHDLLNHAMSELGKCSLATLEIGEALELLDESLGGKWENSDNRVLYHGFNWGEKIEPVSKEILRSHPAGEWQHVAVIHRYVWDGDHAFPGVSYDTHVHSYRLQLKGYNLAVFGDNHQPFLCDTNVAVTTYNHGAAQRRRLDERHIKPGIGLLWDDGHFETIVYDPPEKWIELPADSEELTAAGIDASGLLQSILDLAEQEESFEDAMKRAANAADTPRSIGKLLTHWLEQVRKRIGR